MTVKTNPLRMYTKPYLPIGVDHAELQNLKIGDAIVRIKVDRYSTTPQAVEIPRDLQGRHIFQLGYK